ncbi:MAG: hypothetical protein ACRDWS_05570 [Acidimicrobiia bacterium]
MIRRLVAGLIVVGLAVGIWALWPRDDSDPASTTVPVAVETTTTLAPATTLAGSTTTTVGTHVVTTVEEAEEILRALWFGWFEGIYNQDENRIREVVGTQTMLDAARDAFESAPFESAPAPEGTIVSNTEILRSDAACLAVFSTLDVTSFVGPDAVESSVFVLRVTDGQWKLATVWINREDLWEQDCESRLEPLS